MFKDVLKTVNDNRKRGRNRMRKTIFAVMVALVMLLAMTACGGSSAKVYAGFYSCEFPEGFTATDEYECSFERESEAYPGYEESIDVSIHMGSAEDEIVRSLEYWGEDHSRADDVTYGGITWKVETFTWNDDAPSCTLYTDTEDGNYIEINFFMLAYDSEEVVSMMETFTFEEGAYDKNYDFNMEIMGIE